MAVSASLGYPRTAHVPEDMSPRTMNARCPKGTPQGHALAIFDN
jgi:hypothetical protein